MSSSLPYVQAHSNITKVLEKIQNAATPTRFTQDYLSTKLGITSSAARPVIPFLKKVGFLGSDAVPTELYRRFRNPNERGAAAAEALKIGYAPLFEVNEYAQDLPDSELKGLIVQVTDHEPNARSTQAIAASFKALRDYASFETVGDNLEAPHFDEASSIQVSSQQSDFVPFSREIGLSYTINLNLPATTDIAVFDAIFKSMRENLLR